MEYQPERHLKDGKLNPDVMKRDSIAFGYGRRLVYPAYSPLYTTLSIFSLAAFVLEDT
jgi:hypothetical protein